MSAIPSDLKYTSTHEWVRLDDNGIVRVGITQHAQELLGDMVFVELPDEEEELQAGSECAVVESVKAASDVYCPLSGEIVESNQALVENPGLVNSDPYGQGWLFSMKPTDIEEMRDLLDADDYAAQVE